MFVNFGYIITGVVIVFSLAGGVVWWAYNKNKFRFSFRVWAKDLSTSRLVKARISVNKENKHKKEFTFKNNPSILTMREPQHWSNGKSERWVYPDESGEYQYLSPVSKLLTSKDVDNNVKAIDNVRYMQTRLNPVNRQLALEQFRNNQKRYDATNTAVMGTVFGAIILAVFIMIGIIYGMGTIAKANNAVSENVKHLRDMSAQTDSNTIKILESQSEITTNLAYIYGTISGDVSNGSVVRPVDGFRP